MIHWKALSALACAISLAACSNNSDTNMPAGDPAAPSAAAKQSADAMAASVFIVSPSDGDVVSSPLTVTFGIKGYSVAPAGTYEANTGHHHLLIDTGLPPLGQPVPADAQHVHFGKGQTQTTLELAPGKHTLQLLLGDGNHVPHQPPLTSDIITVTVSE